MDEVRIAENWRKRVSFLSAHKDAAALAQKANSRFS
jgi:hypothetical protein